MRQLGQPVVEDGGIFHFVRVGTLAEFLSALFVPRGTGAARTPLQWRTRHRVDQVHPWQPMSIATAAVAGRGIERIFGGVALRMRMWRISPIFPSSTILRAAMGRPIAVHEGRREFDARLVHSADDLAAFLNVARQRALRKDMLARGGRLDAERRVHLDLCEDAHRVDAAVVQDVVIIQRIFSKPKSSLAFCARSSIQIAGPHELRALHAPQRGRMLFVGDASAADHAKSDFFHCSSPLGSVPRAWFTGAGRHLMRIFRSTLPAVVSVLVDFDVITQPAYCSVPPRRRPTRSGSFRP